jgi:hypothetical protein
MAGCFNLRGAAQRLRRLLTGLPQCSGTDSAVGPDSESDSESEPGAANLNHTPQVYRDCKAGLSGAAGTGPPAGPGSLRTVTPGWAGPARGRRATG